MTPERRLWASVVIQAFWDLKLAVSKVKQYRTMGFKEAEKRAMGDAKSIYWEITRPGFREVCINAGVHPDRLKRGTVRLFKRYGVLTQLMPEYQ